jgi:hypothetical protein
VPQGVSSRFQSLDFYFQSLSRFRLEMHSLVQVLDHLAEEPVYKHLRASRRVDVERNGESVGRFG